MSNGSSAVVSGVVLAVLSGASVAGFNLYTDVQLLKAQTVALEISMVEREETTKRFTEMMHQMDKSLAVQTEAVNALKSAVNRLEERNGIVYISKESKIDRRN
ncbi:MAG: hypothetical protein ACRC6V_00635 [Bacteroidales bacterium]